MSYLYAAYPKRDKRVDFGSPGLTKTGKYKQEQWA